MIEFTRIPFDFTPFPFALVSDQDHVTPVTDTNPSSYSVSLNGEEFISGDGTIDEVGGGFYELSLGRTTQAPVPKLIVVPGRTTSGSTPGYDPVYFRVTGVFGVNIEPVIQGITYPFVFLWVSFVPPIPGLKPVVHISRNGLPFDLPVSHVTSLRFGCYCAFVPTIAIPQDPGNLGVYLLRATVPGADPDDPTQDVAYDSFQVFHNS